MMHCSKSIINVQWAKMAGQCLSLACLECLCGKRNEWYWVVLNKQNFTSKKLSYVTDYNKKTTKNENIFISENQTWIVWLVARIMYCFQSSCNEVMVQEYFRQWLYAVITNIRQIILKIFKVHFLKNRNKFYLAVSCEHKRHIRQHFESHKHLITPLLFWRSNGHFLCTAFGNKSYIKFSKFTSPPLTSSKRLT